MSTVSNTWLQSNRNIAHACRVCKDNLVFAITDKNDVGTVATLNDTLIRALGSSTSKGRWFCRDCTLSLLTLRQKYEEFHFASNSLQAGIIQLRAKLSEKDPIPVTLTSIADSTVQDDQQNSKNNKGVTSSVSSASIDIFSELEKHNAESKHDESAKVNTPSATSVASSPGIGKYVEENRGSPLVNIAVSKPKETDSGTRLTKWPEDVIVDATQPMSKDFENSVHLSQATSDNVSSPSLTKVTRQEDVDKILKIAGSSGSDANAECTEKNDAPLPHKGQGEDEVSRIGKKRKSVSFGNTETLLCIDKRGRKRVKLSQINFTNKPSELISQLQTGGNVSEAEIAEARKSPGQENNELPKKETEKKTELPIKTYIGTGRRRGRPSKRNEIVHLDDPNANANARQETNSTAEISTEPVQGDLLISKTSSDKIDEVEKLNAKETIPKRSKVDKNIKNNLSTECNPTRTSRRTKIGPKSVVNGGKSNPTDIDPVSAANIHPPASSAVSLPFASLKSSPKQLAHQSELLSQLESGGNVSEAKIAEARKSPEQENNELPKKETEKKTELPIKTYIGTGRRRRLPKRKEVVHLDDPNANANAHQETNSTAEISTEPVQGDLLISKTSSGKMDEVEKLNAKETVPNRRNVDKNIKSNSSAELNPIAKIEPKRVVNGGKSNPTDIDPTSAANIDPAASSTVSVPFSSPISSPKQLSHQSDSYNTNYLHCTTVPTSTQINIEMATVSANVIQVYPKKKLILFTSSAHEAVKVPEEFNSIVFKSSYLKAYSGHKKRKFEIAENNAINADLSKENNVDISTDNIEDASKVNDEKLSTTNNETSEGSYEDLSKESDVSKEANECLSKETNEDVSKEDNEDVSEESNISEQCEESSEDVAKEESEGAMVSDAAAQLISIPPELPNVSHTNKNESSEATSCNEFFISRRSNESGFRRDEISFQPDLQFFNVL